MAETLEIKFKDLALTELSREEGAVFRTLILQLWAQCEQIVLDFSCVDFLSVSFLDEAVGKIFLTKPSDEVYNKLKICNLSDSNSSILKSVASARMRQALDREELVNNIQA